MQVLYITAACLTKNTSANMSHNGYLQGLIENGVELDIIMANDSWGEADNKMHRWEQANYHIYNSISIGNRIISFLRRLFPLYSERTISVKEDDHCSSNDSQKKNNKDYNLRNILKRLFYKIFKQDPLYPLNAIWLKNASHFKSDKTYDLVLTNSSPSASHKLMSIFKTNGNVRYKQWVQIWEDPWYDDLYSGRKELIKNEEGKLVKDADKVFYVSPLTLHYQKQLFSDCADKMCFIPLPFLDFAKENHSYNETNKGISFGYFGDYYSHTRNLKPFYDALIKCGFNGNIFGDSDLKFNSTDQVTISGRVTLDVLEKVQNETDILVHLCNLRGGQIPGKIYHYSATHKPILFILDGTDEERKIIHDFFSKYKRYHFCDNNVESITGAMIELTSNFDGHKEEPVMDFSPKQIVSKLIGDIM